MILLDALTKEGGFPESSDEITCNIGFNEDDETQFDVRNMEELVELWEGFCEENDFSPDSVDYVEFILD